MKRLTILAAMTGLSLCAPAQAAWLAKTDARAAIRTAYGPVAQTLDGKLRIGACRRGGRSAVTCRIALNSADTRCTARVSVIDSPTDYVIRARKLRCK